jgi:signal transduction histidine kinase
VPGARVPDGVTHVAAIADPGWSRAALGGDATVAATAAILVPLSARDKRIGTLVVVSDRRGFDEAEVDLAHELGRRIASGVENAGLYGDARRATEVRDDVLSIVSHDLRNPLGTIAVSTEQLLREPANPDRVQRSAERIKRNVERMKRLINDLLEVGRVDAGLVSIAVERVAAGSLVSESIAAFDTALAERAVRVEVAGMPDADLLCDRGRMLQVLQNLIGNAVKFSPDAGVVAIHGARDSGFYEVSVEDHGQGMTPEQTTHVFERYWQAPETKQQGSGLGLYIAKAMVEAHGGRIWVDSMPGQGSTFHVTIPLAAS